MTICETLIYVASHHRRNAMSQTTTIGVNIHPHDSSEITVEDLYEDRSCPVIFIGAGTLNKAVVYLTPEMARDLHSKLGYYLQDADQQADHDAAVEEFFGEPV
jgi:hypothetical protein